MSDELNIPKRFPDLLVRSLVHSIDSNRDLKDILNDFMIAIEEVVQTGMSASILLLDESKKHLRCIAAPSLAEEYNKQIDGINIGPNVGSCGTAAYCEHPIYVVDIENDPLWANFKEYALKQGLRSCWSVPIINKSGNVLGTFAMYYRTCRSPNLEERSLIGDCAELAATLITRHGEVSGKTA